VLASARASQPAPAPPSDLGVEDLSEATAYTATYKAANGSHWARYSSVPVNYQDEDGAWHAIDTTLHPDPATPGSFESGADWWHAQFSALSTSGTTGGVALDAPNGSVDLVPQGTKAVEPEVDPDDPSTVVYKGAWDGADLEYTVTSTGVEEHILLDDTSAPTTFDFSSPGHDLGATGTDLAGQGAGLPSGWSFRQPSVAERHHAFSSGAGQSLRAYSGGAQVSISRSWLVSQPASAFPIDVDPTVQSPGMPPWVWAPKNTYPNNTASFCMSSGGYTGHRSFTR
jgi:hypothetical protein